MSVSIPTQPAEIETKTVDVQILLMGGHQYTVTLKSDEPLLRSLLAVFLARFNGKSDNVLFQIPVNSEASSLCFSSEHMIGVITTPPIAIRPKD